MGAQRRRSDSLDLLDGEQPATPRAEARSEASIVTEVAGLVVRALGEVETYADKTISRAEGVDKIVGRILRLN